MPDLPYALAPSDTVTDVVAFVQELRARGVRFYLADNRPSMAGRVSEDVMEAIVARRSEIVAQLQDEARAGRPLDVPARRSLAPPHLHHAERPGEFEELAAWLATAELPKEKYLIRPGLLVDDPERSHRWLKDAVSGQPTGQVRRALLWRLRDLKRLADNGWSLERPKEV